MTLVFDLDDTLYLESQFVQSGFRAVADELQYKHGWNHSVLMSEMNNTLRLEGRGKIFNILLASRGALTKKAARECIYTYRNHKPNITLGHEAKTFLENWAHNLYLVTDGHKFVQHRKIEALGLQQYFTKIYITHRYGIRYAKPSTYCFEQIARLERCTIDKLIYVGDNPAKDFVGLNRLGATTVRVLTGAHANVRARPGYDARFHIETLAELNEQVLARL